MSVGQAASAQPVRAVRGDGVDVLLELPRQPGLADARLAGDDDELRVPLLGRDVEELLDHPQLSVPADERSLESVDAQVAADRGSRTDCAMQVERLALALQQMTANGLVLQPRRGQRPCLV